MLVSLYQSDPTQCEEISAKLVADDPELMSLAKEAAGRGDIGSAAVIGYVIRSSNQDAQNIIAAELAAFKPDGESRLLSTIGLTLLGAVMGGRAVVAKGPLYKTTKEARVAAEALGNTKINEAVHNGQAVFRKGNTYITRDLDGHNGGAWKMASSVKDLASKDTRAGTYDKNLNRIGD
jgi:filamentous hemagglutinin